MRTIQTLIGRMEDLDYLRRTVAAGECCSIVGVSNLGKSALLRFLCKEDTSASGTCLYVDCNQVCEHTARVLFSVTWQALAESLEARLKEPELLAQVHHWSNQIVDAPARLTSQTAFDAGLEFALEHLPQPLALCFDEFDEVYQHLEPQTFLNLRALRDRYGSALVYVTATERELAHLTSTREQGEFSELVAPRVHFLHFWTAEDAHRFCQEFAQREHVTFDESDLAVIWQNAGGHPGLTQAVCYALGAATGEPARDAQQERMIHQLVQAQLSSDENVQAECEKIWEDLEPDEREALLSLHRGNSAAIVWHGLRAKSIVRDGDEGPIPFGRLFGEFVRRQKLMHRPNERGVYLDVDAGQVWVDGREIQELSDLEYRLLLYLYGRLDRLCDKYGIVEAVWGQEYVDRVDDARIEKLISRTRQKIEPDPTHPRFLLSVRGRGYKLVRS